MGSQNLTSPNRAFGYHDRDLVGDRQRAKPFPFAFVGQVSAEACYVMVDVDLL